MADSTLQNLPLMASPALADLLLAADVSESNTPKKLDITKLRDLILNNNAGFTTLGGQLKLITWMNANSLQLKNLAAATVDNDAVNYYQVKDAIMSLGGITPGTPSLSDKGAFLRIAASTITNPWGGFYMFYWCVDTGAGTTFSLVGDNLVASSGATVNFDGSVANIVNVIKDSGWVGKYVHCALRYRNIKSLSALSATGHLLISLPAYGDIINSSLPDVARGLSISSAGNRLFIEADLPEPPSPGASYQLELLFDDYAGTIIAGNETGLIRTSSYDPSFTYDIPLSLNKLDYVHARIVSVSLTGSKQATDTVHTSLAFDSDALSDSMIGVLATRLAGILVTQGDEPLKVKV